MPLDFSYSQVLYNDVEDTYMFVQNVYEDDEQFITMERDVEDVLECEEEVVEEKFEEYLEKDL